MPYEYLLYEQLGRVVRLTLNRPEKLNALSVALHTELLQAAKQAEADPNTHAVIIRGAGRAFCAGYDITPTPERGAQQATRTIRSDISRMEDTVGRWNVLWNLRIPTIAQVHGYCVAGGTDLALHCDMTALQLATRISHIGKDLLTANKQIVNKGLELMGRSLLQQIALEHDAIAHLAPEALEFHRIAQEKGLKAALEWRDGPFR